MQITYDELVEETFNFEGRDFWYWFINNQVLDFDTKTAILDDYASKYIPHIVRYLREQGLIVENQSLIVENNDNA
tara:strand:+ start:361 stop:585 length:225 start_codon:yes stop_codon:yes gene_type:complete